MAARSKEVGDLRCPERGFSAPFNQHAPSDQAADAPGDAFRALPDAPGDAFRALPADDAAANAACRHDAGALVEHGMCGGFSWLCTAAGQAFRNALVGHGAQGGFADTAWRWLARHGASRRHDPHAPATAPVTSTRGLVCVP